MRNEISTALIDLARQHPIIFLTGDLGFMALECLQEALGERFINAGVAEQNMVSVAAGLALSGWQAWVYSIAPFCYARPFEQIRNDACLNKLPIKLVGNGGGYAYGAMGGTHHALEDYGILSTLKNMHIFVPAFASDVKPIVDKMANSPHPNYLRLGKCELPQNIPLPPYQAWRRILKGSKQLIICMGPLAGNLINACREHDISKRPEIWVVTEFPFSFQEIPLEFLQQLKNSHSLCIVEEHVAQGGLGQRLTWLLQLNDIRLPRLYHAYAQGYPSETYGSQTFHRVECGLDAKSILKMIIDHPSEGILKHRISQLLPNF